MTTLSIFSRETARFPDATVPPPLFQGGDSLIDISSMTRETLPIAAEVVCHGDVERLRFDDARAAPAFYYLDAPCTVANISGQGADTVYARIGNVRPGFIPFHNRPNMVKWAVDALNWRVGSAPSVPTPPPPVVDALNWRAWSDWVNSLGNALLAIDQREIALDEAMDDLADLDEYAAEKGLPPPATRAKDAARAFLRKVVREVPRVFAVSPWDNGKVVVHTRGAKGFGVGVYFSAEGGASFYVTRPKSEGGNEEHHYSRADGVPNEFILAALRGLGE